MGGLKTLFKQTFVYGLATVLPRLLNIILVPLYTSKAVLENTSDYGQVSIIFSYFIICNVILSYGMETAFFRFYNKEKQPKAVLGTSCITILITSLLFLVITLLARDILETLLLIDRKYLTIIIWTLFLDAMVLIPFAWLRATGKPVKYAVIKIANVSLSLSLNLLIFLWLKPQFELQNFWSSLYVPNNEITYIFISNLIASLFTFLILLSVYWQIQWRFDIQLWKRMMRYALPVLISGMAFTINETFDKILLQRLLPSDISESQVGMYAACYKIGVLMTLFTTAFRLGIEPYFFKHFNSIKPQYHYARILEAFVALGTSMLLVVIVGADFIKQILISDAAYWEAMWIVPFILLANLCLGVYHNLSVWYKVTDRTKFGAYFSLSGAVLTLGINFYLIPTIGFKASAIATLIAYSLMMFLSFVFGRKYYPIPYNLKKIGFQILLSVTLAFTYFFNFRENYTVGILMIIVFLLYISYSEKELILRILKIQNANKNFK